MIAIVGVLVALLLPAVQAARESARRTQCQSNLRNIALATLQLHDAVLAFPPARLRARNDFSVDACENSQPSWLARLLPYVEEGAAAAEWDLYQNFDWHDASVREYAPAIYRCPTRRTSQQAVLPAGVYEEEFTFPCGCSFTETIELSSGAVGDYAANHGDFAVGPFDELIYWRGGNGTGVIISSRPQCRGGLPAGWLDKVRLKDLVDGASNTALVGEMHIPLDKLTQVPENGPMYNGRDLPAFARIGGVGIGLARGPSDKSVEVIGFGSWHPGVCPFAMADGAVRVVANEMDTQTLRSMCRRDDNYEPPLPSSVPL